MRHLPSPEKQFDPLPDRSDGLIYDVRNQSRRPDDPAASRVVGRRVKSSPLKVIPGEIEHAREWRNGFPTPFVPKGLYRFKTHEAADAWMWKRITRPKQGWAKGSDW